MRQLPDRLPALRSATRQRAGWPANESLYSRLRSPRRASTISMFPPSTCAPRHAQRLALLQGLMDTDGGWSRGTVEFGSCNQSLALAVVELGRSLGQKASAAEGRATLYGKDCGPRWRVSWTPTINVFRLRRKAEQFKTDGDPSLRNHHRMIKSAELIDPKPMRCLTVDSPHSMYLAGEGMIPTHNTKAGANWTLEMALSKPDIHVGVCGPTVRGRARDLHRRRSRASSPRRSAAASKSRHTTRICRNSSWSTAPRSGASPPRNRTASGARTCRTAGSMSWRPSATSSSSMRA